MPNLLGKARNILNRERETLVRRELKERGLPTEIAEEVDERQEKRNRMIRRDLKGEKKLGGKPTGFKRRLSELGDELKARPRKDKGGFRVKERIKAFAKGFKG